MYVCHIVNIFDIDITGWKSLCTDYSQC